MAIVLSVLFQFMDSDYPFGIFKLLLLLKLISFQKIIATILNWNIKKTKYVSLSKQFQNPIKKS